MSRPWRIEYEGALYHVLSRGNDRSDIFIDNQDRNRFLDSLAEMADRFGVDVFAFVLMDNHYHLLLRTNRANLSKSMQWFGVTYTSRFNKRHGRSGHLFQGRFKSILIENDAYLLQLSYYIHRNPLRAGMVKRLADYRWSSYRSYAYGRNSYEWLDTHYLLAQLINSADPHQTYRDNNQAYAKEEQHLWEDLRHGLILGSRKFSDVIKQKYLPDVPHKELPQQRQLRDSKNIAVFLSRAVKTLGCDVQHFKQAKRLSGNDALERDMLLYILYREGCWSNQQIADIFDLTYSAVSRRVQLLKKKIKTNRALSVKLKELYAQIKM